MGSIQEHPFNRQTVYHQPRFEDLSAWSRYTIFGQILIPICFSICFINSVIKILEQATHCDGEGVTEALFVNRRITKINRSRDAHSGPTIHFNGGDMLLFYTLCIEITWQTLADSEICPPSGLEKPCHISPVAYATPPLFRFINIIFIIYTRNYIVFIRIMFKTGLKDYIL